MHILLIDSHVAAGETNSHQTFTATALSSPINNRLSNFNTGLVTVTRLSLTWCIVENLARRVPNAGYAERESVLFLPYIPKLA